MNEPKRRRWFQLHLSTLIALSFIAGGLLWANLVVHEDVKTNFEVKSTQYDFRGWPWPAAYKDLTLVIDGGLVSMIHDQTVINYPLLLANVGMAAGILIMAALVVEWRVRKRHE